MKWKVRSTTRQTVCGHGRRDAFLSCQSKSMCVLRFNNLEVLCEIERVRVKIDSVLEERVA